MQQYEPQEIINRFHPLAESSARASFRVWEEFHKNRLSELGAILNALKILLVHTEDWDVNPDGLWEELESEMTRIRLWTESLNYLAKEDIKTKIMDHLAGDFEAAVAEMPDTLSLPIDEFYWEAYGDDGLVRRVRKNFQPVKKNIKITIIRFLNKYRDFRHKPPFQMPKEERILQLQSLVLFYIKNPLSKFLMEEWQRYLQAVTGQLFVLQIHIKDFSSKSLLLQELSTILDPDKKNEIFNNLFELAEILKAIDEILEDLKKYELQFLERFKISWVKIAEDFSNAWNRAGTFQLKDKKYSGERLAHLEYSIRSRYEKHAANWRIHLLTLKEEWQKNTEVSQIRYRVVRSLYGSSHQLNSGINNTIRPFLTRAHNQLSKTYRDIQKTGDDKALQVLITEKRNSILHALQNLLESIHGVNIVRILENNLHEIDNIVDKIGILYHIYIKQDTERIPPRSISEQIPFKELLKNEVYLPFNRHFNTQVRESESEVKHILRVISEIDQQIEFHAASTLKLIEHSGQLPVFARAKNEMSEGLDRAVKLFANLEKTILNIPDRCSKELLQYTIEFENDLEKFLNSEDLIQFKAQLKRKQIKQGFRNSTHFFLAGVKSFIPSTARKTKLKLKNIWLRFFNLGLQSDVQVPSNLEEIREYLTDTQDRIARLPYIYQKLFHFDALNDQQFFTNRIKEIRRIEEEFRNWQNGSAPTIAIIGERGSGITTFLNYLEKQIFSDLPVSRVVLKKPEYSEKNLLKLICQALGLAKQDTWEALERKIGVQDSRKICIIENIQFMYLKAVFGFNAIEQFLEFLSRTKNSVFWIVTCTLYSWDFLTKAVDINSYFNRVLTLHKMNIEELKSIILKRHRASGYHLEFEPSTNSKKKHNYNGKPQNIQHEEEYFQRLHKIAGGNIATAILLWLRSIKEFSQVKMVLTTKFEYDFSYLKKLSENDLLTLGSIIHQEILSAEHHSLIFGQTIDKSRLQLENLETEGIIMKNGNGFKIHPFIYRPLITTLKDVHILS